jgi:putative ABC transport system ATP-binding protein
MNLGQLVAAELIVTVILGSFAKIGKDLESYYDLMASVDKLGKLFDLPVESFDRLQLARRPGAYGLSAVDVKLDNIPTDAQSFEIEAGKSYAVFSSNELRRGRLMDGFVGQLKPSSGHFLLDNFRVDALSAESLQQKISLVKEVELFEGSVEENIRLGRGRIGSHEVNEIIQQLGLREIIAGLDDGFQTKLWISGYPLSQGQAIRLVLARSLVASPAVLFIDGLLDRLSDKDTQDILERLNHFKGEVTIVVSTGRKFIAQWAESCLNIDNNQWELKKFDG